jgi:hypothetical protein
MAQYSVSLNWVAQYLRVQVLFIDGLAARPGVTEQLLALLQDADLFQNLICQEVAFCYELVACLRKLGKGICPRVDLSTVFFVPH